MPQAWYSPLDFVAAYCVPVVGTNQHLEHLYTPLANSFQWLIRPKDTYAFFEDESFASKRLHKFTNFTSDILSVPLKVSAMWKRGRMRVVDSSFGLESSCCEKVEQSGKLCGWDAAYRDFSLVAGQQPG